MKKSGARPKKASEIAVAAPAQAEAKDFPIVGIGASAGGLAAIEEFLSAMPFVTEKGIALVFVQHLSPDHKSMLCELVKRYTRMQVQEVEDGMEVQPNRAYIIPPNRDMALLGGKLQLFEQAGTRGARLSIDHFFRSLAADQHERAICIVLSGTGSDGTLGLRAVKGEGGMAMVQTPESAEFDGMPTSAIATGVVDYVLPPAQMPAQLIAYVNRIFSNELRPALAMRQADDTLAKICILLRAKTGHDFSQYKQNTILRRTQRRMALREVTEARDYLQLLRHDAAEADALFRDLLIGVTSFFRDPEAFETVKAIAIPRLFANLKPGGAVRIWVCACSTGEEAYSLAMLVQEHLEEIQQVFKVQIFATDIDRAATEQARTGNFPASSAADISPERLRRFFSQNADGSYRIQKVIRDLLIFSEQDVLKDPPFSKLDLISCRNLMIYLNSDLQKRLLPVFHYALKPGGLLFLGNSETAGDPSGFFEPIDRKARLYSSRQLAAGLRGGIGGIFTTTVEARLRSGAAGAPPYAAKPNWREVTEQAALQHFMQAGVLINGHGDILYFHGRTGNFLEPSPGEAKANVLTMARDGLRHELTTALYRAAVKKEAVQVEALQIESLGRPITINFSIVPAAIATGTSGEELFLVIFAERPARVEKPGKGGFPAGSAGELEERINGLRQELVAKDEYIQSIIEEMETSSEELKSSNEEMQSVNEEMQSTNEELETSKEELQSVNEELATVNAELQQKVADLSRANNDMNNLLAGTGVGTLFVDHDLHIQRFTPSITQMINLIQSDLGRPLADIVSNLLGYDQLVADVENVLDTLIPLEREVQTKAGGWFLLGIRPYRTLEHVIEGAVITFVEVTERRLTERFRLATEVEAMGIVFFEIDGPITFANDAFLLMCGFSRLDLEAGRISWATMTPPEWIADSMKAATELRAKGRSTPYEKEYVRKDGSRRWALFAAHLIGEGEAVEYIVDITETKEAESKLREIEDKYNALLMARAAN